MAHTPSFSKRIHEPSLLMKRLEYDRLLKWNDERKDIIHPLQGVLDEVSAKHLIYSDFYQRIKTVITPLSLYIGPRFRSLNVWYVNSEVIVNQYDNDYNNIKNRLDNLGVVYTDVSLYDPLVLQSIESLDKKLVEDHRVGLRSDVVYYDIQDGRVIPDHRIMSCTTTIQEYVVRFFLNANKETVSAIIKNPYDIFGCVALLVNPHDKRYKKARGRDIILPITNRSVPVISYEGVSVEWLGTRILVPTHNREDFKIALELWLPLDVYAFDKFGKFTSYAKDFVGKPIGEFSDNVIKFLDDISNLETVTTKQTVEYRDKYTQNKLYPILEKNMYIGLWYQSFQDTNFIQSDSTFVGDVSSLKEDVDKEENFCMSNQDPYQPSLWLFWWYFDKQVSLYDQNLFQDLVMDFVRWWLLQLPAKWDDIVHVFSLQFKWEYIWKTFFEVRTQHTVYNNAIEIYELIDRSVDTIPTDEDIDSLLEYIDLWGNFIHTKHGYILQDESSYYYDSDYIALAFLLSQIPENKVNLIIEKDTTTFAKYFIYLSYFLSRKPLDIHVYCLEPNTIFWSHRDNTKNMMSDVVRVLMLQSMHHSEHESIEKTFTADDIDRFINKRWNLCRVVPKIPYTQLDILAKDLLQVSSQMHDYDKYLISTIHELYDEVIFLLHKHYTDQIVSLVISTLREKISDILIYIVKIKPSPVSDKVSFYVVNFANHFLYPLIPTTAVGLFDNLGMQRLSTFFDQDPTFLINKNIKCNFLIQFINQWYIETKKPERIQWFILRANKDFLDYAREVLPDLQDFLGKEYMIELLDEHQDWPEWIETHKVFAMQWWIIQTTEKLDIQISPVIETQESLWMLRKQLSYKQQLLQTIKNTLIRLRTTGQKDKLDHYQLQIEDLEKEITDIEYQISKLKYF